MDRDLRLLDPQRLGHFLLRALRVLRRRPDFASVRFHARDGGRRLHRGLAEVRNVVLRGDHPRRTGQRALRVARVAGHGARGADSGGELLAVGRRVVGGVRTVVPVDHQGGAPAQRGPGVVGHDGHAAEGLERGGQGQGRHAHDAPHARDLQGGGVVDPRHRAAHDGRPRDDRDEHPWHADVGPELRLARDVGRPVDEGERGADALTFRFRPQDDAFGAGHGERSGGGGQLAERQRASGLRIVDLVVARNEARCGYVPARGGGGHQHRAHTRPRHAHDRPELAHAA